MPRPRLRRHTCVRPHHHFFKPRGVPMNSLRITQLSHEEMESLWLCDYRGLGQIAAARHMRTSQSTFQRILKSARKKVASALIDGQAISLDDHV